MSYIVMECHPGYAVLLDEEGRFLKAANLHYEVGQTVTNPVLMQQKPAKQRHILRWAGSGIAAVAACLLLIFGISFYQEYMAPYSSIYLTINPEVRMDLNHHGLVVGVYGTNEDGEKLVEGYDARGKEKTTVADELIDRAIEMGFLSEGGQVSFSIDSPDDILFQEYGIELRSEVEEYLKGRMTITVAVFQGKYGYEANTSSSSTASASSSGSSQPPASSKPSSSAPSSSGPAKGQTGSLPQGSGDSGYGDSNYGDSRYTSSSDTAVSRPVRPSSAPSSSGNSSSGQKPGNSDSGYDDSDKNETNSDDGEDDSGYDSPESRPASQAGDSEYEDENDRDEDDDEEDEDNDD